LLILNASAPMAKSLGVIHVDGTDCLVVVVSAILISTPPCPVLEAAGLAAKDAGSADAFVKVKMGDKKYRTQYIPGSVNPEWNAAFTLYVPPQGSAAATATAT